MGDVPMVSMSLRLMMAATAVFQLVLLVAVPIPSPVATRRLWTRKRRHDALYADRGALADPFAARVLPVVALGGVLAVLAAVIWPAETVVYLIPAGTRFPLWLAAIGGICLLAGNALVAAAVLTLQRHTGFDASGESRRLVTNGIFRLVQHPIVSGMGLIYLGFFLALPSPLVLVGLGCYGWHQRRRLVVEEALLAGRFEHRYQDYRHRVGRFWPRGFVRLWNG